MPQVHGVTAARPLTAVSKALQQALRVTHAKIAESDCSLVTGQHAVPRVALVYLHHEPAL
jgi:hypothetical protein